MFETLPLFAIAICAAAAVVCWLLRDALSSVARGWLLALAPACAFVIALTGSPALFAGEKGKLDVVYSWLPSLGLNLSFHLDGLSLLFVLLVSGIGACILVYGGYYFAPHGDAPHSGGHSDGREKTPGDARFFVYLMLFMASMLGLVMAGDVITLFLFWEGTSITSFLLVAYKYKDRTARDGAFKALFITGGGGIALLGGLIIAASVAGSGDLSKIAASRDALTGSALYPVMLGLIALGAFTKSAQFPAHSWLPGAMSAPTPASAFLHSATMVKAGIYLMARLQPGLGGTDLWFGLLTIVGAATLLTGAILGLRQNDLKALLAYSTISQLGALMMLIGQHEGEAFKALVVGILAHALYKGALFMIAGAVDHATGTRDIRLLGGLRAVMPVTFVIAALAGLSMAGLPPTFGFLGKETLLAAATEAGGAAIVLAAISTLTGALILVQAAMLVIDAFVTRPAPALGKDAYDAQHAHEPAYGMLLGPGLLAVLGLVIGLLPLSYPTDLLAAAAKAAFGEKVKVSLALWTGLNLPLLLSVIAIGGGTALFLARGRLFPRSAAQGVTAHPRALDLGYIGAVRGLDGLAWLITRVQNGQVRLYLGVMIIGAAVLFTHFNALQLPVAAPAAPFNPLLDTLRMLGLVIAVAASLASVVMRRDLHAILALGASGLAMALLIMLEPSPDVALVQIIVDILTTVVLVLALSKLPGLSSSGEKAYARPGPKSNAQKEKARQKPVVPRSAVQWGNLALASVAGIAMAVICYGALSTRARASIVTPYYEANSKPLTGAADIVGAIVVDFRGFDTLVEISVFSMAGIGVYTLLRHARQKHDKHLPPAQPIGPQPFPDSITGIGGWRTSAFVHALANVVLPLAFLIGIVHMLYGHDQPGDGFTAGVIISLAIAFCYLAFGYQATRVRLPWLRTHWLIGLGILTVMTGSAIPAFLGQSFFAPMDFGQMLGLPLPDGVYLSTSTMFELAICLAVMGSASHILDTLGRPEDVASAN